MVHSGGAVEGEDRWGSPITLECDDAIIEHFSGDVNANLETTRKAFEEIKAHGINYDQCSDVKDGMGSEFVGTDMEPMIIPFLAGHLVTGNGSKYLWATKGGNLNMSTMMELLSNPYSFEEAVQSLEARLDSEYVKRWGFGQLCRIGYRILTMD